MTAAGANAAYIDSYHVGNSLTGDASAAALGHWVGQRGGTHRVGTHILGGASLTQINQSQYSGNVRAIRNPGAIPRAFANNQFGALTLQTHPGGGSRLSDDRSAFRSLIQQAKANGLNDDLQVFLYSPWAKIDVMKSGNWTAPLSGDNPSTVHSRAYSQRLLDALRADQPNGEPAIRVVPTGEVIHRLHQAIANGELSYLTSFDDLYRDDTHLSLDVGRFVAATTMYAVVTGESPVGLTLPNGYFVARTDASGQPIGLIHDQPGAVLELQSFVWNVVSEHPSALVPEPVGLPLVWLGAAFFARRRHKR